MATRILAAWYLLGQDSDFPAVNFDAWDLNAPVNTHVNVQGDHARYVPSSVLFPEVDADLMGYCSLIRTIGAASTVLLKNQNNALPLKAPKSIAIIGNDAGANPSGPNGCALLRLVSTRSRLKELSSGLPTVEETPVYLEKVGAVV